MALEPSNRDWLGALLRRPGAVRAGGQLVEDVACEVIDTYLAGCVRACLEGAPVPAWPMDPPGQFEERLAGRTKFHGIALLLAQHRSVLSDWPAAAAAAVKDEARLQALWEASHRAAISRLLAAFQAAGIRAAVMKGTALAYGFHADPAARRRGDTDLYLPHAPRAAARAVLMQSGFTPAGERRPTQEPWSTAARDGFTHEVDIHWRINDSLAISNALDRLHCETRFAVLPRLSPEARALGGIDNVILTCVNRASHRSFGYHVEGDPVEDGDRLIWAADIKLVTEGFSAGDWQMLADLAAASGTGSLVRSGLAFADRTVGLRIPDAYLDRLGGSPGRDLAIAYLEEPSGITRFRRDLAAVSGPGELLALLRLQLWPGRRGMARWYPDAHTSPLWVLRLRRLGALGLRWLGIRP